MLFAIEIQRILAGTQGEQPILDVRNIVGFFSEPANFHEIDAFVADLLSALAAGKDGAGKDAPGKDAIERQILPGILTALMKKNELTIARSLIEKFSKYKATPDESSKRLCEPLLVKLQELMHDSADMGVSGEQLKIIKMLITLGIDVGDWGSILETEMELWRKDIEAFKKFLSFKTPSSCLMKLKVEADRESCELVEAEFKGFATKFQVCIPSEGDRAVVQDVRTFDLHSQETRLQTPPSLFDLALATTDELPSFVDPLQLNPVTMGYHDTLVRAAATELAKPKNNAAFCDVIVDYCYRHLQTGRKIFEEDEPLVSLLKLTYENARGELPGSLLDFKREASQSSTRRTTMAARASTASSRMRFSTRRSSTATLSRSEEHAAQAMAAPESADSELLAIKLTKVLEDYELPANVVSTMRAIWRAMEAKSFGNEILRKRNLSVLMAMLWRCHFMPMFKEAHFEEMNLIYEIIFSGGLIENSASRAAAAFVQRVEEDPVFHQAMGKLIDQVAPGCFEGLECRQYFSALCEQNKKDRERRPRHSSSTSEDEVVEQLSTSEKTTAQRALNQKYLDAVRVEGNLVDESAIRQFMTPSHGLCHDAGSMVPLLTKEISRAVKRPVRQTVNLTEDDLSKERCLTQWANEIHEVVFKELFQPRGELSSYIAAFIDEWVVRNNHDENYGIATAYVQRLIYLNYLKQVCLAMVAEHLKDVNAPATDPGVQRALKNIGWLYWYLEDIAYGDRFRGADEFEIEVLGVAVEKVGWWRTAWDNFLKNPMLKSSAGVLAFDIVLVFLGFSQLNTPWDSATLTLTAGAAVPSFIASFWVDPWIRRKRRNALVGTAVGQQAAPLQDLYQRTRPASEQARPMQPSGQKVKEMQMKERLMDESGDLEAGNQIGGVYAALYPQGDEAGRRSPDKQPSFPRPVTRLRAAAAGE